jgi:drug/metabolite transporter (DMT)-like permease
MQGSRRSATAFAIGSILLWSWSGVCFASGSRLIGPAVYLSFMTATGAGTIIVLQIFRRRPLLGLVRLPLKVIVSGFFGVALYTVMLAMAFGMAAESDLGQVNLLNYLWPIWIVLLSILLLEEHPGGLTVIGGALMGFTGVVLSKGIEGLLRPPVDWRPHLMALTGGFLWALYCVLLRRWRIPEEKGGTAFHFSVCALLAAVLAGWRGEWQVFPGLDPKAVIWILFGGIGPVGLAYHWWEIAIKRGSVRLIVLLAYFIPVGSSLLIGLFFKESLNPGLLPGAFLIAVGAWLSGRGSSR